MIIFLDTNIIGKLSNPNGITQALECQAWFERLLVRGVYFTSSELCFYELKRSLIIELNRGGTNRGIERLNDLRMFVDVLPVDRLVSDIAAEIWAVARSQGTPTADRKNLDIDIIIAAHWQLLSQQFPGREVVISTTNIKHLVLFANAREWESITY
jgi:predicted nucleic acid-binding protein